MDLDALASSLAPTALAPPADLSPAKPRRAPRAPDAPPLADACPGTSAAAARPEPGEAPPGARSGPSDSDLDAVLAGGEAGLGARFDRLVADHQGEAHEGLTRARLEARSLALEVDRAAADVETAERTLLRTRTDEARVALEAARQREATARQVADLAARDVRGQEAAQGAARQALAGQLFRRAIGHASPDGVMASLAPDLERLWQTYLALVAQVDAIEATLAAAREAAELVPVVGRLAGVELDAADRDSALGQLHRQWPGLASVFLFGRGVRPVDVADVHARWARLLAARAAAAGVVRHLSYWLNPGGG